MIMRRKEKEITDKSAIEAVIRKSLVCRIGLSEGDTPYVVPVCFGYQDRTIYAHGSLKGKKVDMLRKNPNVCFEFDINAKIVEAEHACDWSINYQSVIGFGKASLVTDPDEKRKVLEVIMRQYSDKAFHFPENKLAATGIIRIEITSMTGKQDGFLPEQPPRST
jgi:nitroimidazol reductase NimA-like FMN-containing flavoprotein (pyridoxamine 5'-phosphate oxidase superfamily)